MVPLPHLTEDLPLERDLSHVTRTFSPTGAATLTILPVPLSIGECTMYYIMNIKLVIEIHGWHKIKTSGMTMERLPR